jgi:hypothetical protein
MKRKKTVKTAKRAKTPKKPGLLGMNKGLQAEYNAIKALEIKAERQNVAARRQIAEHCQMVREGEGGKYGKEAMAKLAKALGWSSSTVYGHANVAKTWPDKNEFAALATRLNKFKKPLGWALIALLATVADVDRREKLTADALAHGWSVRDLRKELGLGAASEDEATAAPQPKVPRVLATAVRSYATEMSGLTRNSATFGERLAEQIREAVPTDLSDEIVSELSKIRAEVSELLKQLDGYLEQVEQRRSAAPRLKDDRKEQEADLPDKFRDKFYQKPEEALAAS